MAMALLPVFAVCGVLRAAAMTEIVLDDPLAVTTLSAADSSERTYRLNAGRLVVSHSGALDNAQVVIAQGAVLRFAASCALYAGNSISGAGTVEVGYGATVGTYSRFPGFSGNWVLDGGKVVSSRLDVGSILGLYRFNDTLHPYADSSPRNIGLAVGYDIAGNGEGSNNPQLVDDPERGKVLCLDGKSWLTGSGDNGVQPGFDIGNSPFTLAMWVKTASNSMIEDSYKNGLMFMYGGRSNTQRLIFRFNGSLKSLLYSNWGQDLQFTASAPDGGSWIHYAVTHDGCGTIRFYVNGTLVNEDVGRNGAVPNLQSGRLSIGHAIAYGSNGDTHPFKGYIDDIVFAKSVLPVSALMNIGSGMLTGDGDPAGNFTDVTNLGGGEIDPGTNLTVAANARLSAEECGVELLRTNLVEAWEFETGNGETASTNSFTLNGFSANGSAAPFVTFPYDEDRGGRVATLDGTKNAYLATADDSGSAIPYPDDYPLGSSPFTLTMWVKTAASDKTGLFCFGNPNWQSEGAAGKGFSMRLADSNSKILLAYGSNYTIDIGGSGLSVWRHIAVTYADSTVKLYVDGTCIKTNNFTVSVDVSQINHKFFNLGKYHSSPVYGTVSFDNVRVYRKALAAAEIALDKSAKSVRCLAPDRTFATEPNVTVDSGKVWMLDAAKESVAGLSGAGTVVLANDAQLSVGTDMGFLGSVQGEGNLVLSPGYEFAAYAAGVVSPISCGATLTLPAVAYVSLDCNIREVVPTEFILAVGNPIVPPSDFSGWTLRDASGNVIVPQGSIKDIEFAVVGKRLVMSIVKVGMKVIVR